MQSQALRTGAQLKRQRATTEIQEIPPKYKKINFYCEGGEAQMFREVVGSPSLEILKTQQDIVLCSLLKLTLLLKQGAWIR